MPRFACLWADAVRGSDWSECAEKNSVRYGPSFCLLLFLGTLDGATCSRASITTLECATLVFAHTAPHARILAGLECP